LILVELLTIAVYTFFSEHTLNEKFANKIVNKVASQ